MTRHAKPHEGAGGQVLLDEAWLVTSNRLSTWWLGK